MYKQPKGCLSQLFDKSTQNNQLLLLLIYMDKRRRYEQSQQQSDEDEQNIYIRKRTPKFTKNTLDGITFSKIIINISNTQYPVLEVVAGLLGWKTQLGNSQTWDVFWTDHAIQPEQLFKLQDHQKINHFPGMYTLAKKNQLARNLMKMRKQFQEEYNFFPLTWNLPSEFNQFAVYFNSNHEAGTKETYIAKPEASSQGKGIFLTRKLQQLKQIGDNQNYIVQKYIDKPFLINGLKFDFRIYVLLAGCNPLRIYVYKQGLVRFATQIYKKPKNKNLNEACMHLTNYAINKQNPNFIFNKSQNRMDIGHKRSLTSVFKLLENQKVDVVSLRKNINDLIIKTIITGQPLLAHLYKLSLPQNYSNDICFQILGFDVLLDENAKPILLQVNHTPSFTTDTPLDRLIKRNLIKDTLTLMNINLKTKSEKVNLKKESNQLRSQRRKIKLNYLEKQNLCRQQQLKRDQYQDNNLGNFQKIYPITDNNLNIKYDQMLKFSNKSFQQYTGIKKKYKSTSREMHLEISSDHRIPSLGNNTYSPKKQSGIALKQKQCLNPKQIIAQITLPILQQNQIKQVKNIKSEEFSNQLKQINKPTPKVQYPTIIKSTLFNTQMLPQTKTKLPQPTATTMMLMKKQSQQRQHTTNILEEDQYQVYKKSSVGQFITPKNFNMRKQEKQVMIRKVPINFQLYLKKQLDQKARSARIIAWSKNG